MLTNWNIEFPAKLLSWWPIVGWDHLQLSQNVVNINFFHILGGGLLIFPDGITEFLIKSSKVIWVLILVLNGYGSLRSLLLHHKVHILDLLLRLQLLIEHPDRIGAQVSLVWLASTTVLSSSTFRSLSLPFLLGALLGMQEAHVLAVKRGFAHILRLFREALASLLDPLNRLNVLLLLGLSSFFLL